MRNALKTAGLAVLILAAGAALLGATFNRPYNDLQLFTMLNGQPIRFVMPDGGASGMFGSGQQCMAVTPGDVMKLTPPAAIYLCLPSPTAAGGTGVVWDGGCNSTATDMNMGDYIGSNVEHYVVNKDATFMCQMPVTGSVSTPVFRLQ